MKWILPLLLLQVLGCQTAQQRDFEFASSRTTQLKPLSSWPATQCRVRVQLTEPALARYREMHPDLVIEAVNHWRWLANERGCELRSLTLENSPVLESQKALLANVFCVLLQTHYVNSPFDDIVFEPQHIHSNLETVQIRLGERPELGLFLKRDQFRIDTVTQSRGTFGATYAEVLQRQTWLPERIEQRKDSAGITLDNLHYTGTTINGRPMLRSFTVQLGEEQTVPHSQVVINRCLVD